MILFPLSSGSVQAVTVKLVFSGLLWRSGRVGSGSVTMAAEVARGHGRWVTWGAQGCPGRRHTSDFHESELFWGDKKHQTPPRRLGRGGGGGGLSGV